MATTERTIPSGAEDEGPEGHRITIRQAAEPDLEAIAALEAQSFSNPWHPDTFRSLLTQERARILVGEDPDQGVVGYAVVWWVLEQAELANLAVGEEFQGRGIGSALLDKVIEFAGMRGIETLFLEVRMSNETAFRLYEKRGFQQIAVRKGYYQNPREDARILAKTLGNTCSQFQKMR